MSILDKNGVQRLWTNAIGTFATREALDDVSDLIPEQIDNALADLGAITIDIEGAIDGTPATIDADTFGGYTLDKFVMYNINGEDGDIDTTVDADMLGGIPASEYATKAYVEELLGGIENGSY